MYILHKFAKKIKKAWTAGKTIAIIRLTTKEVMHMLTAYVLVLIAVGMDLKCMRISNRLILIGLGMALIQRFVCEGIQGVLTGVCHISFPVIVLYLLFLIGALGAGDIKLFSVVGGFVNFKVLVWCMIYAFLLAAVFSLGKVLYFAICRRELGRHKMHFSVAILVGLAMAHAMQL